MKLSFFRLLILFILFNLITGCIKPPVLQPTHSKLIPTDPPMLTATPSPTHQPTLVMNTATQLPIVPTATLPALPIHTRNDMRAVLDYPTGALKIYQQIRYTNQTGSDLTELGFYAEPNQYPDVLSIQLVSLTGRPEAGYSLVNNVLFIPLANAPLHNGESVEIVFDYSLNLPKTHSESGNGIFGRSVLQTNLLDWYFWLAPFKAEKGWLIHPPSVVGEHTIYPHQDIHLDLQITNAPEKLVVTGSTVPELLDGVYRFDQPNARNLVVSLSPYYEVAQKQIGGITLNSYSFPGHEKSSLHVLETTARAVEIYGKIISPYQRPVLNIVETNLADGLEADGMYFLGSRFYGEKYLEERSLLTLLAAHETAHQWWYAMVSNDQALEPWLDESFATYMEREYFSASGPDGAYWWKAYRITINLSETWVNQSVYDFKSFLPYRNAIYLRGAQFMDALHTKLGEEKFDEFLQAYFLAGDSQEFTTTDLFFKTLSQFMDYSDIQTTFFSNEQ